MARFLGTFVLVIAALGALSASASAITNGELDGNRHLYAGALVVDGRPACSAVLVSPTATSSKQSASPAGRQSRKSDTGSWVEATFCRPVSGTFHAPASQTSQA